MPHSTTSIPSPQKASHMWHHKPTLTLNTAPPHQKLCPVPQTDGTLDRQPGIPNAFATTNNNTTFAHPGLKHHRCHPSQSSENTVQTLLPYCTTEPPLTITQVIALSDVVGSLRELVLLALSAAMGDAESMGGLEGAIGRQAAVGVVEFFEEEWEIEG